MDNLISVAVSADTIIRREKRKNCKEEKRKKCEMYEVVDRILGPLRFFISRYIG